MIRVFPTEAAAKDEARRRGDEYAAVLICRGWAVERRVKRTWWCHDGYLEADA